MVDVESILFIPCRLNIHWLPFCRTVWFCSRVSNDALCLVHIGEVLNFLQQLFFNANILELLHHIEAAHLHLFDISEKQAACVSDSFIGKHKMYLDAVSSELAFTGKGRQANSVNHGLYKIIVFGKLGLLYIPFQHSTLFRR